VLDVNNIYILDVLMLLLFTMGIILLRQGENKSEFMIILISNNLIPLIPIVNHHKKRKKEILSRSWHIRTLV
jgi:hypothetical protein